MKKILYPFEIAQTVNKYDDNGFNHLLNLEYNRQFFLYYYKWLKKSFQKSLINNQLKDYNKYNQNYTYNFPFSLRNYSNKSKDLIMDNLGFFQISFGCSKGCYFCGCDAPYYKKPISIPFFQIQFLLDKYTYVFVKNYTYFYWASDPLDYKYHNKDYSNILKIYKKNLNKLPYTSTALKESNLSVYYKVQKNINRISYLGSDKLIYDKLYNNFKDNTFEGYSMKKSLYCGINGYQNNRYDYGIGCLNGVLLTTLGCYNLVNIGKCNNYFPHGLLSYPILEINNELVKQDTNLVNYLSTKIVMYDYINLRSFGERYNKFVVFLKDFERIYMCICSKIKADEGIISIEKVIQISNQEYFNLVFSEKGYNILLQIEKGNE